MAKRIGLGIVVAILLLGIRWGYHQYREHEELDKFADAVLTRNPQVELNCAPLGKLKVTFFTEGVPESVISENIPAIVKRWDDIWPESYKALVKAANDYNGGKDLNEKPDVSVETPTTSFSQDVEWKISYASKGGEYGIWLKGTTVTRSKEDY